MRGATVHTPHQVSLVQYSGAAVGAQLEELHHTRLYASRSRVKGVKCGPWAACARLQLGA
jgi:hypothetical protein